MELHSIQLLFIFQLGFNHADEFTVNWWDHLFNSTAKNIQSNGNNVDSNYIQATEVKVL
jgi:hypothetical protein